MNKHEECQGCSLANICRGEPITKLNNCPCLECSVKMVCSEVCEDRREFLHDFYKKEAIGITQNYEIRRLI